MDFINFLVEDLRSQYSDKKWFHGTGHDISKFDYNFLGKGNDALGVGFYFSDNPDTASAYALDSIKDPHYKRIGLPSEPTTPNVVPVHLKLKKATSHTKPLTRLQIGKIIKDAPDYENDIYNFGDVKYEGEHKVLNRAIDQYRDMSALDAKHVLFNDFFKDNPEKFLKSFTKHTGYDHSIHTQPTGEQHVVVFHPTQIKSIHAKFEKDNDNLVESISSCPECNANYVMLEKRMYGYATCSNGHKYKPIFTK